jgi:hypothetical protein
MQEAILVTCRLFTRATFKAFGAKESASEHKKNKRVKKRRYGCLIEAIETLLEMRLVCCEKLRDILMFGIIYHLKSKQNIQYLL